MCIERMNFHFSRFTTKLDKYIFQSKICTLKLVSQKRPECDLHFVTASDSSHFKSSLQLIRSIESRIDASITYYNLGLTQEEKLELVENHKSIKVIDFPFTEFPNWFAINEFAGHYAWKANIIEAAAEKRIGHLFWVDAGCKLLFDISIARGILEKDGYFILNASGSLGDLTHQITVERLQAQERVNTPMLSAAFIGFDLQNVVAFELVTKWASHSRQKMIIAPPGSNRLNHRQDQSVLTILINEIEGLRTKRYRNVASRQFGFLIHQDVD